MVKKYPLTLIFTIILFVLTTIYILSTRESTAPKSKPSIATDTLQDTDGGDSPEPHTLSILYLRDKMYPGSDITVEQTLAPGSNYSQYLISYQSEVYKIYALLTVPTDEKPKIGWPVVIFNHGYIPPAEYRTNERYTAYVDGFARNGYIVFKSDYRGHGDSEGTAAGGYGSNSYTIDILNAVSSIKKYKDVDPERIGMWGHSMGGFITLRSMVVNNGIKAGVIWAGVVASYPDLLTRWRRNTPPPGIPTRAFGWRQQLAAQYGSPEENPEFWNSISANSYLNDISGPIQLHHGTADSSVPVEFSERLEKQMKQAGQMVKLYTYPGDDHNISNNFNTAMERSVAFFDAYLKNSQ